MENRNYVIDRLKSRTMSIDEFNFENLQCPSISSFFTYTDIMDLNSIAKSIKYAGKPDVKYREIDLIMRRRGFEKFIGGTNRVTYRPLEFNNFLVKVATDAVGIGDNPREFQNQMIFKPFVTKVFEITPDGTLGFFERVEPITSREEFFSIAKDVYEVIKNWFVGEYVLEDIGTKYFMNWGVRKGFGPVLLDFPYVYKLDGNKLFCNAPSSTSPTGCCEGIIDYDAGYNFLYCTKCGVKYKAKELAQAVKLNKVIVKTKGDINMQIKLTGGTKNVNKNISTGEEFGSKVAKSYPMSNTHKVNLDTSADSNKSDISISVKKPTRKVENRPVEEEVKIAKDEVKKDRSKAESPIEFDESLIKDEYKEKNEEAIVKANPVEFAKIRVKELVEIIENASEDEQKEISDIFLECMKKELGFDELVQKEADKIVQKRLAEISKAEKSEDDKEMTAKDLLNCAIKSLERSNAQFKELKEKCKKGKKSYQKLIDGKMKEIIKLDISDEFAQIIANILFEGEYQLSISSDNVFIKESEESPDIKYLIADINASIIRNIEGLQLPIFNFDDDSSFAIDIETIRCAFESANINVDSDSEDNTEVDAEDFKYGDIKFFAANVVNGKDEFNLDQTGKILVIIGDNGNFLTTGPNNDIIAIDVIDDKSVASLAIVSSDWLTSSLNKKDEEEIESDSEQEIVEEVSAKTGVFAPGTPVGVNGVVSEE